MAKDMKTIDLNLLPLETLAEMANEKAEQVERNAKKTVSDAMDCGRYLEAAKEQVEPGKWLEWLGANWNYSRQTATTYMRLADHGKRFPSVEYQSVREAMKMIADEKAEAEPEPIVPRSERKSGRVEVVSIPEESREFQDEPDIDVPFSPPDDDPTPDLPTQRKTAKGSEKVPEDKKSKTQTITPEFVDEPEKDPWEYMTFGDIIAVAIGKLSDETQQKKAAKELRKLADKLDPPTKFSKPTVEDVAAYCNERKNNIDAETFVAHYAANGWKLANGNKLNDWKSAVITWEKRNDSGSKQAGRAIAGTGRIKPDAIDESAITWR